jgi:diketogulonate reductase-like aldo/keto reductase
MQKVKLLAGTNMPAIGFGTWQIVPNRKAKAAVLDALDAGYRLIDTAKIYGNEKGVGDAIHESGLAREGLFITTKLWKGEQGYDNALRAFETSLRLLGVDYLDLYLIHWPGGVGDRNESWRALTRLYEEGRARAIGVSNFTIKHLEQLKNISPITPAVNQIEFHPYLYKEQIELLDYCRTKGIVIEAYSPLAHGLINSEQDKGGSVLSSIGGKHGKLPAQIVLRWCVQHGAVPIPKTSSREHMHDNIDIFDFELTDQEMVEINNLSKGVRTCWDPNKIA